MNDLVLKNLRRKIEEKTETNREIKKRSKKRRFGIKGPTCVERKKERKKERMNDLILKDLQV